MPWRWPVSSCPAGAGSSGPDGGQVPSAALLAFALLVQLPAGRSFDGSPPGGYPADSLRAATDSAGVDSLARALPRTVAGMVESPASGDRSPTGALLRSAALPGWGQFYNERPVKGIVLGALELGLLALLVDEHIRAESARDDFLESGDSGDEAEYETHRERRLDLVWLTAASWLYGMMDAYVDAHLFAFDRENERFGREAGIGAGVVLRF